MKKRKVRTLKELYDVTEKILEPEMTPVLKGSCRIQGPTEEIDRETQKNTGSSRAEKRFRRHSVSETVSRRAESGTCNVCAAPCSSCMHFNRAVSCVELVVKDEFSDETSRGKVGSRCSVSDGNVLHSFKNRACEGQHHIASETSNLLSATSSHGSLSENAESKASLRAFDTSENVEMLTKVSVVGTTANQQLFSKPQSVSRQSVIISSSSVAADVGPRIISNQYEQHIGLECDGDNISCVSGAINENTPVGDLNLDVDRKDASCSSASIGSFLPKGFNKAVHVQSAPGCLTEFHCEIEESHSKPKRPSMCEESMRKDSNINSETAGLLDGSGPSVVPSLKDSCGNCSRKVWSPCPHSQSGKLIVHNSDAKDLKENSCFLQKDKPSECPTEHVETSLAKLSTYNSGSAEKSVTHNCNNSLLKFGSSKASSSGASMKIYPHIEAGNSIYTGDSPTGYMNVSDLNDQVENSSAPPEVADNHEPPLQSQLVDDRDGSDIVEADVKVCDICGDAGREYLLAICSRCSDGAEHTYCMKIMMDKVPEGEWLCEECKIKEEDESQKQVKFETELGTSKELCVKEESCNSGGTLKSKLSPKLDIKLADSEGSRATKYGPSSQFSSKIHSDSLEVASAAKQVLQISSGSPKPSSPRKKAPLSRESSFKNLDKGKVKPSHPIPSFSSHANNSQNTALSPTTAHNPSRILPRLQLPTGTLLKSNSFNTVNSKPKVKLLQEDPSEKHRLPRDSATGSTKKGPIRRIRKSVSFKTGSSFSNAGESKVKVVSPNPSRDKDLRGLKQAKEWNLIERKNSFRSDNALVPPTTCSNISSLKAEQKIASCGEAMSMLLPATNNRDLKSFQPDGKLSSTNLLANQVSETPSALAGCSDVKIQSSFSSRGVDSTSFNGRCNSVEQKPSLVSTKDEPVANYVDGPCSPDAVLQNSLPQTWESTDEDRKREPSFSQSQQNDSAGGRSICCHKCKEIGHTAEICPIGIPVSVLEASAARSSREVMNRIIKSKVAAETSVLKRSGIYNKSQLPDKSDNLSRSSADLSCEVGSKDQLTSSHCLRNLTSTAGVHGEQESFGSTTADSSTRTVTKLKQHALNSTKVECVARAGDPVISLLDENNLKRSLSDTPNLASSVSFSLRESIPEVDHIWKGGFEVQRNGRSVDFYDGIQAHLSNCASPKVLEVVNKFPQKVQLEEVPRLNTWPTQFQNCATEDNIALYFFAKDHESYARSYNSLLENMIKHDLALKGNFDGVELLIFPSTQLHEKSQRWNMLFFLWGVFRGKRLSCAEHLSGSLKKLSAGNLNVMSLEQEFPTPVMAYSDREYTFSRSMNAQETINSTPSVHLPFFSSSGTFDQKCLGLEENSNPGLSVLDTNLLPRISTSGAKLRAEIKGNGTSMKENGDPKTKEKMDVGLCSNQNSDLRKGETVPTCLDSSNCRHASFPLNSPGRQETCPGSCKVLPIRASSLARGAVSVGNRIEEEVLEKMEGSIRYEEKCQGKMKDDLIRVEIDLESDPLEKDLICSRKRPYHASLEMVSQASGETSTSIGQVLPWKGKLDCIFSNGENDCKKMKSGYSEIYESNTSRDQNCLSYSFPSLMQDMDPNFPSVNQRLEGAHDDVVLLPERLRTTKNYILPVDLGPAKLCKLGSDSIPLQVLSSDDEDQVESEAPNLELALGAEKRWPNKEILPLFAEVADEKNNQWERQVLVEDNGDDGLLDSLSLSLCIPISDKEKTVKTVSKPQHPLPESHHVDTSLILFGGSSNT